MQKLLIIFLGVTARFVGSHLLLESNNNTNLRSTKHFNWSGSKPSCETPCRNSGGEVCGKRDRNCCVVGRCSRGTFSENCSQRLNIPDCTSGGVNPTYGPFATGGGYPGTVVGGYSNPGTGVGGYSNPGYPSGGGVGYTGVGGYPGSTVGYPSTVGGGYSTGVKSNSVCRDECKRIYKVCEIKSTKTRYCCRNGCSSSHGCRSNGVNDNGIIQLPGCPVVIS